jgi:hypothetical protein
VNGIFEMASNENWKGDQIETLYRAFVTTPIRINEGTALNSAQDLLPPAIP